MERWHTCAPFFAALAAIAVVAAGCAPARSAQPAPVARIGAALSLSGPAHLIGMAQESGIKLAQDEINASHLLGGTRLEVVIADDASNREQAAAVFQQFIEDTHALAILGPTISDNALSVDPTAQQAGVPVLAISNSAGGITAIGDFIFRESLSESQLTPQVVRTVRSRMNLHGAALLSSDTDPNRAGSHGFKAVLEKAGVQITSEQTFSVDQIDFSDELQEIAASQPDALFITAPSSVAASVLIQARQQGLTMPIVGSNAFNADAVLRGAGAAAEGLIVGGAWSPTNESPRNQQFIQAYRARYGVDPDQVVAQAYSGVYILANAIRASQTTVDARAVRDALAQTSDLDTPLGKFSFNAHHDPNYSAMVQVVRNGRFQPY